MATAAFKTRRECAAERTGEMDVLRVELRAEAARAARAEEARAAVEAKLSAAEQHEQGLLMRLLEQVWRSQWPPLARFQHP